MLHDRLISSAVLIGLIAVCVMLDWNAPPERSGLWLLPLLFFFAVGTAWEMGTLIRGARIAVRRYLGVSGALVCICGTCIPMFWDAISQTPYPANCPIGRVGWLGISVGAALGMIFSVELWRFGRSTWPHATGTTVTAIACTSLIAIYVGVAMSCLILARGVRPGHEGILALVGLIAVTKSGDIGAYATGKLIGKHKLIPRISPGKTWEGLGGGVCLSVAVAYAWFWSWQLTNSSSAWWGPAVLGIVLALCGVAGDLAESMIKRDVGKKDSGTLLSGMGGVWDVTDSPIGIAIPGYLLLVSGLV